MIVLACEYKLHIFYERLDLSAYLFRLIMLIFFFQKTYDPQRLGNLHNFLNKNLLFFQNVKNNKKKMSIQHNFVLDYFFRNEKQNLKFLPYIKFSKKLYSYLNGKC